MPCAVALTNSPAFSPSRVSSIFCKPSSSSPDNLKIHNHRSPSTPRYSSSTTPRSPLSLRFQKQINEIKDNNITNYENGADSSFDFSGSSSSSTLLKRKRPTKLEIPTAPVCSPVNTPTGVEGLDEVADEGYGYSVYCKRGRRGAMEDRYSASVNLQGDSKQAFFGVFDGHGGSKAAEFAAKNMGKYIMAEVTSRDEDHIKEEVEDGYLNTDANFLKEASASGGACCVTALIRNGDLVVSNAGDCRAVMSRSGIAEALTSDHKPSRNDEKERIEALGGYVDWCHGVWRIQGSLAVSRGIGDRDLKQWVIAKPETKISKISRDCEFVILASDGLWDKVSNQEAVDVVRSLCVGVDKAELVSACKKLAELSMARGSNDDTTVMVIQLSHFAPH